MKVSPLLLMYLVILASAYLCTYSLSGFLVTGIRLAFLLDRYAFRLLPQIEPVSWKREAILASVFFLVGVSLGAAVSLQALPRLPEVRDVCSEGSFCRLSHVVEHQVYWLPAFLRKRVASFYYQLGRLDCGLWAPDICPLRSLRGVRVPIYFVHGQEDELVPVSEGQALYASCAGRKQWWAVPGASHYRVRQDFHDEYPHRLHAFLEQCLKGASP